jgi:hypothetical protein
LGWLRYKAEVSTDYEWEGRANDGSECTTSKTWVVIEIGVRIYSDELHLERRNTTDSRLDLHVSESGRRFKRVILSSLSSPHVVQSYTVLRSPHSTTPKHS